MAESVGTEGDEQVWSDYLAHHRFYELVSRFNLDTEYALGLRFDSDSKAQEKWEKWVKRQI